MLVTAWSCEVSVPVSRSGDHTAPPFGDNRGTQAFWAMYVEAMNWRVMGVREYAAALRLRLSRV
jgi:hypothetical protein